MLNAMIYGRLTGDPTIRETQRGQVCNLNVAVDTAAIKDGKPKVEFIAVSVWGKRGESCAQYLHKGDSVAVCGDLTKDEYMSSRTNQMVTQLRMSASNVQFGQRASSQNSESNDDDDEPMFG